MDNLTLTVRELATALNIGKNAAYDLTKREGFPALRFGTRIVVPIEPLKEWLRQNGFEKVQL